MIIYLYLTILITVSIITGIIVTIIEKKGLRAQRTSKVSMVSTPKVVSRVQQQVQYEEPVLMPLPVVDAENEIQKQYTMVIEPTGEMPVVSQEQKEEEYDYDTPYIIAVIDEM